MFIEYLKIISLPTLFSLLNDQQQKFLGIWLWILYKKDMNKSPRQKLKYFRLVCFKNQRALSKILIKIRQWVEMKLVSDLIGMQLCSTCNIIKGMH